MNEAAASESGSYFMASIFVLFLWWGCYYNRDFAKEMAILEVKDMKAHGHMLTVNPLAPCTRFVAMGNVSVKTKLEYGWVAVFSLSDGYNQ